MILKGDRMPNKKIKKKMEEANKEAKKNDDIIIVAILALSFLGALIGMALITTSTPTKTLYITSNLFPIKVVGGNLNGNTTEYVFYGTLQPNGTECISRVVIVNYPFNYTTQSNSPIPQNTTITNPKQIAGIYYSSLITAMFNIPNGYTLLCPDIINASKVI